MTKALSKSDFLDEILVSWRRGTRGPLPQLSSLQILTALVLIRNSGPIGRRALAQTLRIKDGVARGLLERLVERRIATIVEGGVSLSDTGLKKVDQELARLGIAKIREFDETDLVPGKKSVVVHVMHRYNEGMNGISERDEAVRAGADGTIIIAMLNGKLVIPPDNKDTRDMSRDEDSRLRAVFRPSEKDLLVMGFADNNGSSLAGALAAVVRLRSE